MDSLRKSLKRKTMKINDKTQHFIVGFLLSILGLIFLPLIVLGFIFGVGKEVYDKYTGRGVVELNDMLATFAGSLLALSVILVSRLVNPDLLYTEICILTPLTILSC
jgi:VanZ family protein